jgi:hypothetical protein
MKFHEISLNQTSPNTIQEKQLRFDVSRINRKFLDIPYGLYTLPQKSESLLPASCDRPFPMISTINRNANSNCVKSYLKRLKYLP